ncbi:hypothetical protein AB0395_45465 [Streptosporangium sp. NPDC051023]|uniref:hypothetical protein n=1 Tax=Streptosporangium sp. NPDC051023 TaxID=3155410 RepID=UPI00344EEF66
MTVPAIRRAQVWGHRAERSRRFLVTDVTDTTVRGMDYRVKESWTRTAAIPVDDFLAHYQLLEDVPAHLVERRSA